MALEALRDHLGRLLDLDLVSDSAPAVWAQVMEPQPAVVRAADRLAFKRYTERILHLQDSPRLTALDPQRPGSLLPAMPGNAEACRVSENKALKLAAAYGVDILMVEADNEELGGSLGKFMSGGGKRRPCILVQGGLGPEARTQALWHELGHVVFGHGFAESVPEGDIYSYNGFRTQEYIANTFAGVMMQETVPGALPFFEVNDNAYVENFERYLGRLPHLCGVVLEDFKDYAQLRDLPDNLPAGVERAGEFLRENQELVLQKVAEVKAVLAGTAAANWEAVPAHLPPLQRVRVEDLPSWRHYDDLPPAVAAGYLLYAFGGDREAIKSWSSRPGRWEKLSEPPTPGGPATETEVPAMA